MFRTLALCMPLLLSTAFVAGGAAADDDDKLLQGISIVGDHESPKSLVIVPWKSSALGDALAVSRVLDDGRQPVDRQVFTRALDYYEIRVTSHRASGAEAAQ